MSAHKKKNAGATKNTEVVVGDGQRRPRFAIALGTWQLLLGCLVVLVALVCGGWKVFDHFHNRPKAPTGKPPVVQARQLSEQGKYSDAEKYISQQQAAAKTPSDKAGWYMNAYSTAIDNHHYNDALNFAQQAYAALPGPVTAYAVAQSYEKLNDNANARKYLQIAIDKLDKSAMSYNITKKQYETEMAGLH